MSIGERKEWRDTGAARLASADPEMLERKKAFALKMLKRGDSWEAIKVATKKEFGFGIGAGTVGRLRRQLAKEDRKAKASLGLASARAMQQQPALLAKKKELVLQMLRKNARIVDIHEACRRQFGGMAGHAILNEMRRELRREQRRAERAAAGVPTAALVVVSKQPAVLAVASGTVRLPATPEIIAALAGAKVPFVFDGTRVSLKGG